MHKLQKAFEKIKGERSTSHNGNFSLAYVYWLEKNLLDARLPNSKDGLLWKCLKCGKTYRFEDNAIGCCKMDGFTIQKAGVCLQCGGDAEINELETGHFYCYNCIT